MSRGKEFGLSRFVDPKGDESGRKVANRNYIPLEILQLLTPSVFPLHHLTLKERAIVMLLRNSSVHYD